MDREISIRPSEFDSLPEIPWSDDDDAFNDRVSDRVSGRDRSRCEARARYGTGERTCGRLLDQYGQCDRADSHIHIE